MSEIPTGSAGADTDAGEPVRELAELREEPSPEFVHHILDGINARQTSTQAIEMSWWGLTHLLGEIVDTLFRVIGMREDRNGDA